MDWQTFKEIIIFFDVQTLFPPLEIGKLGYLEQGGIVLIFLNYQNRLF